MKNMEINVKMADLIEAKSSSINVIVRSIT